MTMRKRIFISNTMMVLISLLILFGVGGTSVLLFENELMGRDEENIALSDDTYKVQTILLEQQRESGSWEELSQELSTYKFDLYVSDLQHNKQFSNTRHSEMEYIEELEKSKLTNDKVKLYSMEKVTIARCIISVDDTPYMVYAIYYPKELSLLGMDRGVFEMFVIVFIISGIIIITGLIICSQIFTGMMIKRIMKPVDELNNAAMRIKEGNFDEPVNYSEKDEFGEVCETFNNMQKHLKESIEKTQSYEKARTEMVSGISHDLRTPLTSVKGFIKGMLDGIANTPEKQRQYLEISYKKACDMDVLLQKLFFFSKLETGNMPFFLKETDMGRWIESYVAEKCDKTISSDYDITVIKDDSEYMVNVDKVQMQRVFDNIIENSRKYADVSELHIIITLNKKNDVITIDITDNGKGISEDKLANVFEQFYRGDDSRNSKNDGSGLGLYVCKYIIEEQGGNIRALNKNGFCVEIELPILEK